MHVYKQIGLDINYTDAAMVLEVAYCKLDAAKTEYTQLAKAMKTKAKNRRRRARILILILKQHHLP